MAHTEKRLSSKEIFAGRVVRLTLDTVELENGATSTREVVHHGGGAGILALNEQGEVALVQQYRYSLGRVMTEIPAGKIELGEPPIDTARRELEEECGCTADQLTPFGQVVPTCGYCTEIIYLFLATCIHQTGVQHLDEDEFVDVQWMPLQEAVGMVEDGRIDDSKTVAALLRAWLRRQTGQL